MPPPYRGDGSLEYYTQGNAKLPIVHVIDYEVERRSKLVPDRMSRRAFLGTLGVGGVAVALSACSSPRPATVPTGDSPPLLPDLTAINPQTGRFELPALPYAVNALEPFIDTLTMQIHHDGHHAAYVDQLNAALAQYPALGMQRLEQTLANLNTVPDAIRTSVRNNGGGHSNHSLFWQTLSPQGGRAPAGALAQSIDAAFGTFEMFKDLFSEIAASVFGSGWAWLSLDTIGDLQVYSTPNQDSPYMYNHTPLLGLDVWEHAYYLTYQNQRSDYIDAWWNLINWSTVERRYNQARA